jgi:hypothetical protein
MANCLISIIDSKGEDWVDGYSTGLENQRLIKVRKIQRSQTNSARKIEEIRVKFPESKRILDLYLSNQRLPNSILDRVDYLTKASSQILYVFEEVVKEPSTEGGLFENVNFSSHSCVLDCDYV